ncbi:aspartate/glutamate racemase family protein [Cytobacillus gottheilii]|uniref:Aspartate/glutamate racemase family protein n=1 Tax=Cytobacillus gottheilii TaxID=859144 RepID=A0ABX8FHP1_9BACI|nr:aspartate/glutamate racemase family protein [Cytobacillus gottheilii]QVY63541.1 aspartate/glutamate racemase family protein [Cytobacillus gottheilii]
MKTIGLIGGLSWESTSEYYRIINTAVKNKLGGLHSAKCLIHSFNFEEIADMQRTGKWKEATESMVEAAVKLEQAGAEVIVICTNTMHKMAMEVQEAVSVPLIHIAESTAHAIKQQNLKKVALLGTAFTMEQPFYKDILSKHGIETIIPNEADRQMVHSVIFDELCQGRFLEDSRVKYQELISKLEAEGAEGVILGCTEIPLLIKQEHSSLPLLDTTYLHAMAAVEYAMDLEFYSA